MQQGDCNAPSTFQRLMTSVFCNFVVRFVHVYLDNIFIYSSTIKEHEGHPHIINGSQMVIDADLTASMLDANSETTLSIVIQEQLVMCHQCTLSFLSLY